MTELLGRQHRPCGSGLGSETLIDAGESSENLQTLPPIFLGRGFDRGVGAYDRHQRQQHAEFLGFFEQAQIADWTLAAITDRATASGRSAQSTWRVGDSGDANAVDRACVGRRGCGSPGGRITGPDRWRSRLKKRRGKKLEGGGSSHEVTPVTWEGRNLPVDHPRDPRWISSENPLRDLLEAAQAASVGESQRLSSSSSPFGRVWIRLPANRGDPVPTVQAAGPIKARCSPDGRDRDLVRPRARGEDAP